jgi:hypothetical protein
MLHQASRAEVALARGEVAAGFAHYDRAVDEVGVDLPGWTAGLTPWLLIAASAALTAHVRHAPPGPDPRADELRDLLLSRAPTERDGTAPLDDLPLSGVLLVAAAAWQLRHGGAATHEDGIRLLAIAHRWAYNRSLPSLAWEPLAAMAEQARPGRLDALLAEVAGRSGPDLVPDALRLLAGLRATG